MRENANIRNIFRFSLLSRKRWLFLSLIIAYSLALIGAAIIAAFFAPAWGIVIGILFPVIVLAIAKAVGATNKTILIIALIACTESIGLMIMLTGVIGLFLSDTTFFKLVIPLKGLTPQWTFVTSGMIVMGAILILTLIVSCVLWHIWNRGRNRVENLIEMGTLTASRNVPESGASILSPAASPPSPLVPRAQFINTEIASIKIPASVFLNSPRSTRSQPTPTGHYSPLQPPLTLNNSKSLSSCRLDPNLRLRRSSGSSPAAFLSSPEPPRLRRSLSAENSPGSAAGEPSLSRLSLGLGLIGRETRQESTDRERSSIHNLAIATEMLRGVRAGSSDIPTQSHEDQQINTMMLEQFRNVFF